MTHLHYPEKAKCSFCGRSAHGEWDCAQGKKIYACGGCAMDNLPALIADSARIGTTADAFRAFDRIQLRFWRALALKLLRDNEIRMEGNLP
jgi:hypothetical protein